MLDNPFLSTMLVLFKDRSFKWELHAPNISETNGELNEDATHATWELPLADAINDVHQFHAVIQHGQPWYQGILEFFNIKN